MIKKSKFAPFAFTVMLIGLGSRSSERAVAGPWNGGCKPRLGGFGA
jgi:hypothetical protein